MKTLDLFSKLADILVFIWDSFRKKVYSDAAKKAEETKDSKSIEDLINK